MSAETAAAATPWLIRLLRAADYRTETRPFGVRAFRAADGRALLVVGARAEPVALEAEFPATARHRALLCAEDPGDAMRATAADRGWEIILETRLPERLGAWLLPEGVPSPEAGDASHDRPEPVRDDPAPWAGRIVRPRLGRVDAERLAQVEGSRVTLRLVPFFVAAYRFRPREALDGASDEFERLVAVHSLTGRVEVWDSDDREFVSELDDAYQSLDPGWDEGRLRSAAESALRERHTRVFDHTERRGGAIVVERRRWVPGPDALGIGRGAYVRVPYWYIESSEGRVVLDAVTGRSVSGEERL